MARAGIQPTRRLRCPNPNMRTAITWTGAPPSIRDSHKVSACLPRPDMVTLKARAVGQQQPMSHQPQPLARHCARMHTYPTCLGLMMLCKCYDLPDTAQTLHEAAMQCNAHTAQASAAVCALPYQAVHHAWSGECCLCCQRENRR